MGERVRAPHPGGLKLWTNAWGVRRTFQGFFFVGGFFSPPLVLISAK
jgi:hypothetical protein